MKKKPDITLIVLVLSFFIALAGIQSTTYTQPVVYIEKPPEKPMEILIAILDDIVIFEREGKAYWREIKGESSCE